MAKHLKQNKNSCVNIYHLINAEFSIGRGMNISFLLKELLFELRIGFARYNSAHTVKLNFKTNKSFFNISISQIWHGVYLR